MRVCFLPALQILRDSDYVVVVRHLREYAVEKPPVDALHIRVTVDQGEVACPDPVERSLHYLFSGVAARKALLDDGDSPVPDHVDGDLVVSTTGLSVVSERAEGLLACHVGRVFEAFRVEEVQDGVVVPESGAREPPGSP